MNNKNHDYNSLIYGILETIDSDGITVRVTFHQNNNINYMVDCDKVKGKWFIDTKVFPVELDFLLDMEEKLHMKMIIRMLSNDKLQVNINKQ